MNSVTEFYRTLSNDLQKLIVDVNESKIVNIKVGKHPHVENFRAHSNILMVRSPYFKDKLSTQAIIDSVDENNMIVDIIQEIDAESFPVILRLGKIDSEIIKSKQATSITNLIDIRSMKCISVKTPIFAFNNQNQQALHFGTSDLIINGKTGTCIVKDFQNPIINTRNFNIDNIEVFAVRMKSNQGQNTENA
ncbi:hypothetical protein RhiirB3_470261 [Rhizophagus irregularis]|nr:hypothetical protein RhiirB3_470261 [Rhizophagus irregularis]